MGEYQNSPVAKNLLKANVAHVKITADDLDLLYSWQQIVELRRYCLVKKTPTYEEHVSWFNGKINSNNAIFEKILFLHTPCGVLRLDYDIDYHCWVLSWYIIPDYQCKGIGTLVLEFAKELAGARPIRAYVKRENVASIRVMQKAEFNIFMEDKEGFWYEFNNR